jgi:hypothetical protein
VFWDCKPLEAPLVSHNTPRRFEAQRRELIGRSFKAGLNFLQRKPVIGAFVPVGVTINLIKPEIRLTDTGAQIRPAFDGDAPHGDPCFFQLPAL